MFGEYSLGAFLVLLHHMTLAAALQGAWPGDAAPRGLELAAAALLLLEGLIAAAAKALTPPVLPVLLCLVSWYFRGLTASDYLTASVLLPWRNCVAFSAVLLLLTRLAQQSPPAARHGLALAALYGAGVSTCLMFISPQAVAAAGAWLAARQLSGESPGILEAFAVDGLLGQPRSY
eukprot:Skav224392  [mRNA]  locus=scaffold2452:57603:64129:- [translate_table: standard]